MTSRTRNAVLIVACLATLGALAGCDQAEKAQEQIDGKIDLGTTAEATKLIGDTVKSLGSITDLESAKAALPALKNLDGDFGQLVQKVKEMSPEQKDKLVGVVSKAMPQLESVGDRITSLPGVGDVVGPTLNSILSKVKSLN